ncbi:hypothetical protein Tco_0665666, partial [Tanacetum coccineum]
TRGIANDVIQRMIFGQSSEMIWLGSAELTFLDDDCAEPGSPESRLCEG